MQVQIRRKIREAILQGLAETMKQGEKHSFVSGENKVTIEHLKEGVFRVTYEPKDKQDHTNVHCFTWNARENIWYKL
jgi:pyruvate/2-oxoglutarate/acetoin dehydrogenase E1 component